MSSADDVVEVNTEVSVKDVETTEGLKNAVPGVRTQNNEPSNDLGNSKVNDFSEPIDEIKENGGNVNQTDEEQAGASNGLPEKDSLKESQIDESLDKAEAINMKKLNEEKNKEDDSSSSGSGSYYTGSSESDDESSDKKKDDTEMNKLEDEKTPQPEVSTTTVAQEQDSTIPSTENVNIATETTGDKNGDAERSEPKSYVTMDQTTAQDDTPVNDGQTESKAVKTEGELLSNGISKYEDNMEKLDGEKNKDDSPFSGSGSYTGSGESNDESNDEKKDDTGMGEPEDEKTPQPEVSTTTVIEKQDNTIPYAANVNLATETSGYQIRDAERTEPISDDIVDQTTMENDTQVEKTTVQDDTPVNDNQTEAEAVTTEEKLLPNGISKYEDNDVEQGPDKTGDDISIEKISTDQFGNDGNEHEGDADKSPPFTSGFYTGSNRIPSNDQGEINEKAENADMASLETMPLDNQSETNKEENEKKSDDETTDEGTTDSAKNETIEKVTERQSDSVMIDNVDTQGQDEKRTDDFSGDIASNKPRKTPSESSLESTDGVVEPVADRQTDSMHDADNTTNIPDDNSHEVGRSSVDDDGEIPASKEEAKLTLNRHGMGSEKTEKESDKEDTDTEDKQEELPECEIVKRNFDIEECFPVLETVGETFSKLLHKVKSVTQAYCWRINNHELRDFVKDLNEYNGDLASVKEAYEKCEEFINTLSHDLKDLRQLTDKMNALISKKYRSEGLSTWLVVDDDTKQEEFRLQEERKAHEKASLARASESRAEVTKASTAVAEAVKLAAEAETEAIEAHVIAKKARESAETALRAVEDARIAAEEKKKAEEDAKQRAIERARAKAELARIKREEEERLLEEEARRKGTCIADERKKAEEEKARLENERNNPKNWPRHIYTIEGGELPGVAGCIVRALENMLSRDDVECRCVDQLSGVLTLEDNEERISNIIELNRSKKATTHGERGSRQKLKKTYLTCFVPLTTKKNRVNISNETVFEEPISIAIPHCMTRTVPGREPIIKTLGEKGEWLGLPTSDIFFEDIKDMRFVEAKTKSLGFFVVVLRLKKDKFTFNRSGNKITSNSDSRVTVTCKPGTFRVNTNFQIELQPVDMATVAELRLHGEEECKELVATSPIVHFHIPIRTLLKPLIVSLPFQQSQSKPKRPSTAVHREKMDAPGEQTSLARPVSAITDSKKEDESEDMLHLLERDAHGSWSKVQGVTFTQVKNKDMVIFEIPHSFERFILLRTKSGVGIAKAEKIGNLVENYLLEKPMQVVLRQKSTNALDTLVTCTIASKLNKTLSKLAAEGYNEGPEPGKPLMVREGQVMHIKFRGNVQCISEDAVLKFTYNTYIKCRTCFQVEEIEKYAQKSFDCYLGFAQIYTRGLVPKNVTAETEKSKSQSSGSQQKPVKPEMEESDILLTELLITIPKPEPEPPKPLKTAPVVLCAEGPVTKEILHNIARRLGEEWLKLAHHLGVKPMRIQSILRQNINNEDVSSRYDMLLAWVKRVPRSVDKSEILVKALVACGRSDLADELRGQNQTFRQVRVASAKDSSLRRAFIRIIEDANIVRDWRVMGRGMGLSDLFLQEVEDTCSAERDRCVSCLRKWREVNKHRANVETLCRALDASNFADLAREIKSYG
ncbi:hypothetical protein ScPMuIL_011922 [Solemya velum]